MSGMIIDCQSWIWLALSAGEIWMLDREVFQQIMMQTGMKKIEEKLQFLKSVPLFSKLSNDVLLRLSDALEVVSKKLVFAH